MFQRVSIAVVQFIEEKHKLNELYSECDSRFSTLLYAMSNRGCTVRSANISHCVVSWIYTLVLIFRLLAAPTKQSYRYFWSIQLYCAFDRTHACDCHFQKREYNGGMEYMEFEQKAKKPKMQHTRMELRPSHSLVCADCRCWVTATTTTMTMMM